MFTQPMRSTDTTVPARMANASRACGPMNSSCKGRVLTFQPRLVRGSSASRA